MGVREGSFSVCSRHAVKLLSFIINPPNVYILLAFERSEFRHREFFPGISANMLDSNVIRVIGYVLGILGMLLMMTWATTNIQFTRVISAGKTGNGRPQEPPTLPYTVPWLGSGHAFLSNQGRFFTWLRTKVGSAASICKVRLGPESSYIPLTASTTEAMFKHPKQLGMEKFVLMLEQYGFGMPPQDVEKFNAKHADEGPNHHKGDLIYPLDVLLQRYLLKQDAVNALISEFVRLLHGRLLKDTSITDGKEWVSLDLYTWMKGIMFYASTSAVMGTHIFEVYPNVADDFFSFDSEILRIVYGTPKFLAPEVYAAQQRLLEGCEKWVGDAIKHYRGCTDWDAGDDWEPLLGSRLTRAQEELFEKAGLSLRGKASLELGLMFGLDSNAIPGTAWMLFHVLTSPDDLLTRVLGDLVTVQNADGSLDVSKLTALPLLESIFAEMLRIYTAVNVTREVLSDLVVDGYQLKKGNVVMAPTWLHHHDPKVWKEFRSDHPPPSVFYAERFLRESGGKVIYSTAGLTGKYFPWGGGNHICPGRVFAKQEILAAFAMVLLRYEFEFVDWVKPLSKDKRARFPEPKEGHVGVGVMLPDRDMRVRMRLRS